MKKIVKVIVLRTAGTNCDQETKFAFENLGAQVDAVHIKQLVSKEKSLNDYHILAIPGGFSYGDDIASGKILANELRLTLADDLKKFIQEKKLIIGICNGFQILVKAGILPGFQSNGKAEFSQTTTLTTNDSSKFEARWIYVKPVNECVWTKGIEDLVFLPVAHAEGKFIPENKEVLKKLKENKQIIFCYATKDNGDPRYPENPNGSIENIAGISDETGQVLGLMPHPERHFLFTQHPFWTRLKDSQKSKYGEGAQIFENALTYIKATFL